MLEETLVSLTSDIPYCHCRVIVFTIDIIPTFVSVMIYNSWTSQGEKYIFLGHAFIFYSCALILVYMLLRYYQIWILSVINHVSRMASLT